MNFTRSIAIFFLGCLMAGLLRARAADDAPGPLTQGAASGQPKRTCPPPPAWQKAIDAWKAQKKREPADNYYCLVCHVNYEDEKLVKTHHPVGLGCETCHGMSDKHSEDEDNVTPPDVMFKKAGISLFCTTCHDKQELTEEEEHKELFASETEQKKPCTECHGSKHRLGVRTRKWDKDSGKLTWSDGVRMMETDPGSGQPAASAGKGDGNMP